MAATAYLSRKGLNELWENELFDGDLRCNIVDVRLRPRQDTSQSPFLPSYSASDKCDSTCDNLRMWAETEMRAAVANSHEHAGRLVVAYHIWHECRDTRVPFPTTNDFNQFLTTLGMSSTFPYNFARKQAIPLLRANKDGKLVLTCQTPHFDETTLTMTMVNDPSTQTTFAFVMLCPGEMQFFIDTLRELAVLCSSPLLLPTILYFTMTNLLAKRLHQVHEKLRRVEIANGRLKHIHRNEQIPSDQNFYRSDIDLVEQHFELTRGLAEFVENLGKELCKFVDSLQDTNPTIGPSGGSLPRETAAGSILGPQDPRAAISNDSLADSELREFIRHISLDERSNLLKRQRLLGRIAVQVNVLYNFKQTRIAEATHADSTAMKCLALLTMVFLPANAIATVFGANNLFTATDDGTVYGVTDTFRKVYVPISIIVTILVMIYWALYTYWYDLKPWMKRISYRTGLAARNVGPATNGPRQQNGSQRSTSTRTSRKRKRRRAEDLESGGRSTGLSNPVLLGPLGIVAATPARRDDMELNPRP